MTGHFTNETSEQISLSRLQLIVLGIPEGGEKKMSSSCSVIYIPGEDGRETRASCPNLWLPFSDATLHRARLYIFVSLVPA